MQVTEEETIDQYAQQRKGKSHNGRPRVGEMKKLGKEVSHQTRYRSDGREVLPKSIRCQQEKGKLLPMVEMVMIEEMEKNKQHCKAENRRCKAHNTLAPAGGHPF